MALQAIVNINVDFYDKKYISINAKQLDRETRFLLVTCYSHGELYPLNSAEHSAYIRYKKPDGYCVFNFCDIDDNGKILVELTEQMLAVAGISYTDLVIVNKGNAVIDKNTGEIVAINNSGILSTMPFYIDVYETAFENAEVESSYEYNGLNEALRKAEAEYSEVYRMAKSYAVGGTGERVNEDTDNAKYYYEQSKDNSINAENYMNAAANSAAAAALSETNAKNSETVSKNNAQTTTNNVMYVRNYADRASASETAAKGYATTAQNSMDSAVDSATSASESATNAQTYYLQTEAIVDGLNGAFLPKGTVTFAELIALKESDTLAAGYLYNISDNFTTDDNFRMGAGVPYEAGTNVYYTVDGQFDVLAGTTVTGVKGINETVYRKGNVELTAENVGAIASADIATVDEVTAYLGI